VLEQELGRVCAGRWRLARELLDHSWPGETDQGTRLSQQKIALAGEAGIHAASRRIGQDSDGRHAGLVQPHGCGGGLAHLDQAEHAFLHARAAA
jgi:hypothetical protein